MGTVIKSTASKNIGLKRSWGGERYKGQTISIINRKNRFNKIVYIVYVNNSNKKQFTKYKRK